MSHHPDKHEFTFADLTIRLYSDGHYWLVFWSKEGERVVPPPAFRVMYPNKYDVGSMITLCLGRFGFRLYPEYTYIIKWDDTVVAEFVHEAGAIIVQSPNPDLFVPTGETRIVQTGISKYRVSEKFIEVLNKDDVPIIPSPSYNVKNGYNDASFSSRGFDRGDGQASRMCIGHDTVFSVYNAGRFVRKG